MVCLLAGILCSSAVGARRGSDIFEDILESIIIRNSILTRESHVVRAGPATPTHT